LESNMDKLTLSVQEAAQALGIHKNTLQKLINQGSIRVVRLGRRVLIPTAELRRLLGEDPASRGGE